jgi:hypothetical protein
LRVTLVVRKVIIHPREGMDQRASDTDPHWAANIIRTCMGT